MDDPVSVQAQYAPNNTPTSGQIHTTWQAGDLYMRTRESDESAWSSWHKIVGESGDETDYTFNISKSLTSTNATTAPANCYYNTWQDAPIAPTSTYPYLWMKIVKKTWNESTQSYDSGTARYARMTGEPGTSPYFADLNNEMDAIQCNHDGGVITSQTVSTVISMWKGSAVEAFVIDNIYRNGTQLTWGSTSNGVKASKSGSTVSIEFGTNASIADIDDFKITIHSYNDNTVTRELHFTINGVRANAIYRLVPSHSQIVKKKDGTYVPSGNVTCSVEKTENGSTSTPSSSEYTLEKSVNGGSYTTYSATAASSITSDLKFRLTVGGVVVDLETIPLVSDGVEGKGYKAVVTRNNFTELNWATYGESGHSESWSNTSSIRGNCKTGDWFIVVGTATDTKNYHIATYECSNDSGNLVGTCINHQITKDGVSYCFVFTKAAARVDENNIVTAELAGYAYKYVGGVRSALTSTIIRYGYILTDSDTYVDTTTNSSGFFDAGTWFNGDDITDYGKNSPSIFAAIEIGGTVVHAEMITISVKGSTGGRGKVGRFFYFAGVFNASDTTQTFIVNDAQVPYFEHTENGQKRYHVFNYDTNGTYTMSQMWAISSNWNNKPWESMTNDFKYIITEAIFGQFAHLGSFIISGDYFISQYGTLFYNNNGTIETTVINASNVSTLFGGSVAYAWFADSDPMVDTMPTTGNYKFRPTKCIDALSGEEWMAGGNMHVSQRGDLTVKGATMIDSVATFNDPAFYIDSMQARELYYDVFNVTKGVKYYNGDSVYSGGYYGIGDIRIKANRFFLYSEGNQNRSGISGVSQLHIILPPAHLFVGQSLVIVNETYGFADSEVILEQEYIHGDGVNGICLVDKTLLKVSPDYPYGTGLGLTDGAPYATDGHNQKTGKSYSLYLSNGIWHLYESQQTGHKDYTVSTNVEVGGYSWFEVTAVTGEIVTDWDSVSPEIARTYNVVWMLTRWEKKQ